MYRRCVSVLRYKADGSLNWRESRAAIAALQEHGRAEAKAQLRQRWEHLQSAPAGLHGRSLTRWRQTRGYELEHLVLLVADLEGLEPRPSYRGAGEQVDGAFVVDHRMFLFEARWQDRQATAADVFAFQGKLRGKLVGTLGLFVSIGGFAEDAAKAITWGKEINVLLADMSDLDFAFSTEHKLRDVVAIKMRYAAHLGVVDWPYKRWLDQ